MLQMNVIVIICAIFIVDALALELSDLRVT